MLFDEKSFSSLPGTFFSRAKRDSPKVLQSPAASSGLRGTFYLGVTIEAAPRAAERSGEMDLTETVAKTGASY
jgi:hypothetical protein